MQSLRFLKQLPASVAVQNRERKRNIINCGHFFLPANAKGQHTHSEEKYFDIHHICIPSDVYKFAWQVCQCGCSEIVLLCINYLSTC